MTWFRWSYIKHDKHTILNVGLSFAFPPNWNFEQGGGVYSEALSENTQSFMFDKDLNTPLGGVTRSLQIKAVDLSLFYNHFS